MKPSVSFTPTRPALIEAMLDIAKLRADDVLMDLGSGDGRIVIAAARRGVRAIGIECDLGLAQLSKKMIMEEGFQGLAEIRFGDLFETDLSEATVVTAFLDREPHKQLLKRLAQLRPGVRIVSNTFHLWEHDAEATIPNELHFHTARLWELP